MLIVCSWLVGTVVSKKNLPSFLPSYSPPSTRRGVQAGAERLRGSEAGSDCRQISASPSIAPPPPPLLSPLPDPSFLKARRRCGESSGGAAEQQSLCRDTNSLAPPRHRACRQTRAPGSPKNSTHYPNASTPRSTRRRQPRRPGLPRMRGPGCPRTPPADPSTRHRRSSATDRQAEWSARTEGTSTRGWAPGEVPPAGGPEPEPEPAPARARRARAHTVAYARALAHPVTAPSAFPLLLGRSRRRQQLQRV